MSNKLSGYTNGWGYTRYARAAVALAVVLSVVALSFGVVMAEEKAVPPEWVGIYSTAGKVGLKWKRAPEAVRYQVYRSVSSGKDFRLVATSTDVSYIDADVRPGETYYYVLKSETSGKTLSAYSEERYITVPVAVVGEPVEPPVWTDVKVERRRVELDWEPSASERALAYNVYRSTSPDSGFQLAGSTQDSAFTDHEVSDGVTYYYRLTTLDKDFSETSYSETKSVTYRDPEAVRPGKKPVEVPKGVQEDLPKKIVAKPTKMVAYITKGRDEKLLLSPTDIVLGADGKIYVSDTGSGYIQVYKKNRKFLRTIGGPGEEDGKFERLLGIDVDRDGFVYAADAWTGRIYKFDAEGKLVFTHYMSKDAKKISKDLGLDEPVPDFGVVKIKVADDGRMYVVDNHNNCVVMYKPDGTYIRTFGGFGREEGKFQSPTFAAFGRDGNLFIADCLNARIQVFDPEGGFLWSFGEYGNVLGTFCRPKGVFIAGDGRIYVADSMTHVIQVFDENGRFLFLLANERGRQLNLGTPNGIVMDEEGRIYMVEKLVNRVQIRQVGRSG